jgi:hypothetical protein
MSKQEQINYARYQIRYYRARLDELWIELETANTWEHIRQISIELEEMGKMRRDWQLRLNDLTKDELPARM